LASDLSLHVDIVLQVLQAFAEHMELPKKGWFHFNPPPPEPVEKLNVVISSPIKPLKEIPPYDVHVPFPRTMQTHIMVAQLAKQKEAEEKAPKGK
jgi:hypothetical protein